MRCKLHFNHKIRASSACGRGEKKILMRKYRPRRFSTQYPADDSEEILDFAVDDGTEGTPSAEEDEGGPEDSEVVVDAEEIREWGANYTILEKNMRRFIKMALDLAKRLVDEKKNDLKSTANTYKKYKNHGIVDIIGQRDLKRLKDSLKLHNIDLNKLVGMAAGLEWDFFSLSTPHAWAKI